MKQHFRTFWLQVMLGALSCGCDGLWLSSDDKGYTDGEDVRGWGKDCDEAEADGCLSTGSTGSVEAGALVYADTCATCHGPSGTEGLPTYPSLVELVPEKTNAQLAGIIQWGYGDMPAQNLEDEDLSDVIAYLRETFDGSDDDDGSRSGDVEAVESWDSSGVTITIVNGDGTYTLGMAETATTADPWTGEDCLNGYELSDGTLLYFCHPLDTDGGAFVSIWDDVVAGSRSVSSLDEDTETLFSEDMDGRITYAIWSDPTGDCWTWGHDTSYYVDGADCVEL